MVLINTILRPFSKASKGKSSTIYRTISSIVLESDNQGRPSKKVLQSAPYYLQSSIKRQSFHTTSRIGNASTSAANIAKKATNSTPPPRDTRMAGRRRFYKVVDITKASPPWDHFEDDEVSKNSIENPISPGVDGTKSATNISLQKPSKTSMVMSLIPSHLKKSSSGENELDGTFDWYGITLDGRLMKTPMGMPLSVPSLPLAVAIASEWDDQKEYIQPAQMPLMTLVCTTIDQLTIPAVRESTIDKILSYLKNDTTCYWADPTEDRVLHRRQSKYWRKLHEWVENDDEYGLGFKPAVAIGSGEGLIMSRMRKSKTAGLPHQGELMENARQFLDECDSWTLAAMQNITMEAKSFLVGMGVVQGVQKQSGPFTVDIEKAIMAGRVEEEFQIENWGLVEGGHDYDRLNARIQIHAATVLMEAINVVNEE